MNVRTIGRVIGVAAVIGWVAVVAIRGAVIEQGAGGGAIGAGDAAVRHGPEPAAAGQLSAVGARRVIARTELRRRRRPGHADVQHDADRANRVQHFVETGEFRDGTMLVLLLQGHGTNALPARRGQFATDVHGVEMAVKDSSRVPEGWAYYNFGGSMMGGLRTSAAPQPKASCYNCHVEHAKRDNVFMQFYQMLSDAAPSARK